MFPVGMFSQQDTTDSKKADNLNKVIEKFASINSTPDADGEGGSVTHALMGSSQQVAPMSRLEEPALDIIKSEPQKKEEDSLNSLQSKGGSSPV